MPTPSEFDVPADRPHFAFWPQRLPRTRDAPETSLWYNLEVAARALSRQAPPPVLRPREDVPALRAEADALAGWLQAQGVRRGDRVALFMQNCPQYLVAFHAILRADAVVVPVNAMNKAEEFGHYIVDPGTKVVICGAELAGIVAGANAALPPSQRVARVLATRYADELPDAFDRRAPRRRRRCATGCSPTRRCPPAPRAGATRWPKATCPARTVNGPDDLALLPYTSGTTGLPKGCMHTHRTLMANVVGGAVGLRAAPRASCLGVVPMFHITGMLYGVISPMFAGATVVVMPRWDRELAGRLISRHRVSHWTCIPTMIIDLFASPNYRSFDLSSLRWLRGGGAAMPQAVAQRLIDEFGLHFCEGYGLTETAAPSHANPPRAAEAAVPGHPVLRRRFARGRSGHARGAAARRGRRDRHARPDGVPRLLEEPRGHGGGVRRARGPRVLPHRRPGPHGRGRLLLHHRPAQAHDQRERLQGLAVGGGDCCCTSIRRCRRPASSRRRTPIAARRSRPSSCCAPRPGARPGARHRHLGARAHGRLQGARIVDSSTPCPSRAPARSCGACCRTRKPRAERRPSRHSIQQAPSPSARRPWRLRRHPRLPLDGDLVAARTRRTLNDRCVVPTGYRCVSYCC